MVRRGAVAPLAPALIPAPRRRCYNNETCWQRAQGAATLASSKSWDKAVRLSGIFDSDPKRNPWAGAHLVYLP